MQTPADAGDTAALAAAAAGGGRGATEREVVLARLESLVLGLLRQVLVERRVPELEVRQRSACNVELVATADGQAALALAHKCVRKVFVARSARNFSNLFLVAAIVHRLLSAGDGTDPARSITQRALYYRLKHRFKTQDECNRTISELSCLLEVPRHALGVVCSARGLVSGPLMVRCLRFAPGTGSLPMVVEGEMGDDDDENADEADRKEEAELKAPGQWQDATDNNADHSDVPDSSEFLGSERRSGTSGGGGSGSNCVNLASWCARGGLAIDRTWLMFPSADDENGVGRPPFVHLDSDASCVLVVEKESIFRHLIECGLPERCNLVLITARGFPDVATRVFLHQIWDQLQLPIFGVADCNPFGLSIMLTYTVGSIGMAHEGNPCSVPIRWLGLRPGQLEDWADGAGIEVTPQLEQSWFQPLSRLDRSKLTALASHPLVIATPALQQAVEAMSASDVKCELETFHSLGEDELMLFVEHGIRQQQQQQQQQQQEQQQQPPPQQQRPRDTVAMS